MVLFSWVRFRDRHLAETRKTIPVYKRGGGRQVGSKCGRGEFDGVVGISASCCCLYKSEKKKHVELVEDKTLRDIDQVKWKDQGLLPFCLEGYISSLVVY